MKRNGDILGLAIIAVVGVAAFFFIKSKKFSVTLPSRSEVVSKALADGSYTTFSPPDSDPDSASYPAYFSDSGTVSAVSKSAIDVDGGFAVKGKFYDLVVLPYSITYRSENGNNASTWIVAKRVM